MFYSHVLRIPLFCLVLAVGIFTSVHDVRAQDGGMMITPQRLVFDDHKRSDRTTAGTDRTCHVTPARRCQRGGI